MHSTFIMHNNHQTVQIGIDRSVWVTIGYNSLMIGYNGLSMGRKGFIRGMGMIFSGSPRGIVGEGGGNTCSQRADNFFSL